FFTLELTDSYGDGWNGGSMDVVVNGTAVFSALTIANGTGPEIYQIPVDIGDVVDFNYTAGSFAGENSYQVFDNNSVLIVDQGAGSSVPTSITGVNACPACPDPSGLTASNITSNSADVSWTAGGSEVSWNFEYGPTGYTQGSGGTSSTVSASTTIANQSSLFLTGSNATWSHVYPVVLTSAGATSQGAQTFTINVTSLPAGGAKMRLIKSLANPSNSFFQPSAAGVSLQLGLNTITANAVTFNRYVKMQFNDNSFEFDAITVNGNTIYSSTTTSISGLVAATSYDVYLQGDCASGDLSSWIGPLTFTTPCGAITAPTVETFDNASLPICWTEYQTSGSGWVFSGNPGYAAGTNGRPSGTYAWIDFSGTDVGASLEAPDVDVSSLTAPQLKFNYFSVNTTSADVNELYVETFDGSTWNTIDTIAQLNTSWEEKTVDLSSSIYNNTMVKVRFRAESGGSSTDFYSDLILDDAEVRETPSCFNPNTLVATSLTNNSLDFGWTNGGNETAWNIEYGPAGFTLG
ncbi:MAG: hypothetical protein ACKVJK_23720, partial [Methylophagaceae bacterium]